MVTGTVAGPLNLRLSLTQEDGRSSTCTVHHRASGGRLFGWYMLKRDRLWRQAFGGLDHFTRRKRAARSCLRFWAYSSSRLPAAAKSSSSMML